MWHAILLAIILSDAPPGPGPADPPPEAMQALKDICICLDLWETQDGWGRFDAELRWAWGEYRTLAGLPPSSDRHRFPDAKTCAALLSFNCDVRLWLEGRANWNPLADAALTECKWWHQVWSAAYGAAGASNVNSRRQALGALRDLLGPEEYHLGRLPPHVPVEMFAPVER